MLHKNKGLITNKYILVMKKFGLMTVIFCVCITTYAQSDLKLSLVKDTDGTTSDIEHTYILGVANNSSKNISYSVSAKNVDCNDKSVQKQTPLKQALFNTNKTSKLNSLMNLKARGSQRFAVKITRPKNTTLGAWNCTEVKILDAKNNEDTLIIRSFIQDPNDVN